jgi:hypothetical protein
MFKKAFYLSIIIVFIWLLISLAAFGLNGIIEAFNGEYAWNLFVLWLISFATATIIIDMGQDI